MHDENSIVHCGTQRASREIQPCIVEHSIMTRTSTVHCGSKTKPSIVEHSVRDDNCEAYIVEHSVMTRTATVHGGTQRA